MLQKVLKMSVKELSFSNSATGHELHFSSYSLQYSCGGRIERIDIDIVHETINLSIKKRLKTAIKTLYFTNPCSNHTDHHCLGYAPNLC